MSQKIKGSVHYTEPPSVELVSPLLNLTIMFSVLGHLHLSLSPQTLLSQAIPFPDGLHPATHRCRSKVFAHLSATQTTAGLPMGSTEDVI